MNMIKKWWPCIIRSKTMMFNAAVALFSALEASFHLVQPFIAGDVFAYTTVVLIVGNKVLRAMTNTALENK